jgi:hypothetical protein
MAEPSDNGSPQPRLTSVLEDGFLAGVLGAFVVIVVFLVADWAAGAPLRTPSVLYALVFEGREAAADAPVELTRAVAYNALHLLAWLAVGFALAGLAAWTELHPRLWYLVFVLVLFSYAAFLYATGAFGVPGLGRHQLWIGALFGVAAMAVFLVRRHPGIVEHAEDVWEP